MRHSIILSVPLAVGCGPGEHAPLDTEHLSFHGEEVEGACEGLGALYERELDRLERELGRGLLESVDVYVGLDEVERRCPPGTATQAAAGCVVSPTEVVTSVDALSFQLVDLIRLQHGVQGIPFIEQALPAMIGFARPVNGLIVEASPRSYRDQHVIAPQLEHDWSEASSIDDRLAMHFMHWVAQAYGTRALQAWLWSDAAREGTNVEAAFAEATGEPIALAEERWSDEAERDVFFAGFCHGLPTTSLPAEGLVVEATACCDAPGVEQFAPPELFVGQQCFTLPSDTEVTVENLAREGTLVLRADGCASTFPRSPLILEPGESTTVTMTACRWKAMVIASEQCEARNSIRYAITPS